MDRSWEGRTFVTEDIDAKIQEEGWNWRSLLIHNSDLPQLRDDRGMLSVVVEGLGSLTS